MVKKIFLLSSVLFGLLFLVIPDKCFADASEQLEQAKSYYEAGDYPKAEQIYQDILKQHAGSDFVFQAQKQLTILYIAWGNKTQAEASFEKLANTAANADIAAAVRDMSSYYSSLQKSEEPDKRFQYYQALSICRRQLNVVDQPGSEYAMWSQVRLAMSNIELGDTAVQAAVDKLLAEFSDNAQIARGVHEVALKHRVLKKYKKAIELYRYVVDNWPAADYAAWSQMDLAKSYVAIGDEDAAEAAVNRLLANFSNNPSIAQIVYDIAGCYREAKKHPRAVSLYKHIIDNWPQQKYAMWSLRDLAMSNFDLGDDPNAQAAVDKLIADYSDNVHIPSNVYEIAKYYRKHAKYKKAINLYQRIVDNWPGADHALWSQLDLAMSYATIGEDPNAEAAIDKLVTKFSKNKHIAGVVYEMAKSYRLSEKDEKANQICHLVINNWPKSEHALWAQRDLAKFNITVGDDLSAQAAVDKLIADFSGLGPIAQAVYDIAKQYHTSQKYEKAGLLYQHVIDNWPDDNYAMWAQAGLAKLHIDLGDDVAAQEALDILIADFNDNPALPEAVFIVGEQYYNEAFRCKKEGLDTEAKENFRKAIEVWERIKDLAPSPIIPQARLFVAICYDQIGEYGTAIKHYQAVLDNWPEYQHACSAQFRIARCYQRLRDAGSLAKSEADVMIRAAYEAVVEDYPNCPSANAARNWLNYNKKVVEGGQK